MSVIKIRNIIGCARCNGRHQELLANKFFNPVDEFTHWTTCPTTGEPILIAMEKVYEESMTGELFEVGSKNSVIDNEDREVWTKEDPMVTQLRTGIHPEYGPSSIRSSQNSFKLAVPNLTDEQIKKRIDEQFKYCVEVLHGNASKERKKELLDSAYGGAVNFALGVGTPDVYMYLAKKIIEYNLNY